MMSPRQPLAIAVIVSTVGALGCTPKPRIQTGAGSLQEARKFLEGRWSLLSFEVHPPGKATVAMKGSGTLLYDDFGNLRMELRTDAATAAKLTEAGIEMPNGEISTEGRTVIDLQNRRLTYVIPGQPAAGEPAGPLALSRPRYWDIAGDVLTLTTRADDGTALSVATWKRAR